MEMIWILLAVYVVSALIVGSVTIANFRAAGEKPHWLKALGYVALVLCPGVNTIGAVIVFAGFVMMASSGH